MRLYPPLAGPLSFVEAVSLNLSIEPLYHEVSLISIVLDSKFVELITQFTNCGVHVSERSPVSFRGSPTKYHRTVKQMVL